MSNELIEFNGKEYAVEYTPAKIDFSGYENMLVAVNGLASDTNYTVTADNYTQAKKQRAALNHLRQDINERKLDIVKRAGAPILDMENKIKEITSKIDIASAGISEGIKQLDEHAKQQRHELKKQRIIKAASASGVKPDDIVYNPKWDNKTYSDASFTDEVTQQILELRQRKAEYSDNVKVITDKAEQLGWSSSHWIEQLDIKPLSVVLSDMDNYAADLQKAAQADNERRKREREQLAQQGDKLIDKNTGEVKDKLYTRTLKFTGTKQQMWNLANFMKDNGIEFERVQ